MDEDDRAVKDQQKKNDLEIKDHYFLGEQRIFFIEFSSIVCCLL